MTMRVTCHCVFPPLGVRVRPRLRDGQMKRKRFTEEQIIAVLREHEAGAKAGDLVRKHGVSEATLYNWKAKYGGMDVSDAKRLKVRWSRLVRQFGGLAKVDRIGFYAANFSI